MKRTLEFLSQLSEHNNREWFQANKAAFEASKKEVIALCTFIHNALGKQAPEILRDDPSKALFRIYRDTRFSNDKTPYKNNLGFWLAPGSKQDIRAGFYVHIQPNASFIAAGVWMPPAPELQAIRQEIYFRHEELKSLLNNTKLRKAWGELEGEQLKTAPKGYDKDHPAIDLLRHKSLVLTKNYSNKDLNSENWKDEVVEQLVLTIPFVRFLNAALEMASGD